MLAASPGSSAIISCDNTCWAKKEFKNQLVCDSLKTIFEDLILYTVILKS